MFIEREKVEKFITYSDNLYREIALKTDSMEYFDRCLGIGRNSNSNLKNLLKHNLVYDADMDVSDRYIKNFMEEFEPDVNYKLHKTYMDIEVDLMPNGFKDKGYIGFPDETIAPVPVNIITLIDGKASVIYTFVYNNPENISQQQFITGYNKDPEKVKKEIIDKIYERNEIVINRVNVSFYNSEEETIEAFFKTIHQIDPDICASWNQCFDVTTLINRLTQLYSKKKELREMGIRGYDQMLNTVCDSKYQLVKNKHGEDIYISGRAKYNAHKDKAIVDRMDEFVVLDGIIWVDQMLLYANIRKSTVKESYSLDAISNEELGSEKLDYTGYTIKNLAWKNFMLFFEYNIFKSTLEM